MALAGIAEDSPLSSLDGPPGATAPDLRGLDVDIVIVIDATGSMAWCFEPAKVLAIEILGKAGRLRAARSVRCGVVAYRDVRPGVRGESAASHVQVLEFTNDADKVAAFIKGLSATGGDDEAEDVAGGLSEAFEFQWRVPVPSDNAVNRRSRATGRPVTLRQNSLAAAAAGLVGQARPDSNCRIVLHMWDAPPHGSAYHAASVGDSFADAGPDHDPANSLYLEMAREFALNGIGYVSVRMPPHSGTDALSTNEAWAAFKTAYMRATPRMDPLDFTFGRDAKAGEIVRMMTRATEASIAAFSRSIGGRMVHGRSSLPVSHGGTASAAAGGGSGMSLAAALSGSGVAGAAAGGAGAEDPAAAAGGSAYHAAASRRGTLSRSMGGSHSGAGGAGTYHGGSAVPTVSHAAAGGLSALAASGSHAGGGGSAAAGTGSIRRGTLSRSHAGTGAPAGGS